MLLQCRRRRPTLKQHWFNSVCLLGYVPYNRIIVTDSNTIIYSIISYAAEINILFKILPFHIYQEVNMNGKSVKNENLRNVAILYMLAGMVSKKISLEKLSQT